MINYIMLEPTNKCNLNCSFCNRDKVVKKTKDLKLHELKYILESLKGNTIETFKLQGLGEVFLNKNFDKLCEMIKNYFPDIHLISATNCQWKDFDLFKKSMEYIDMIYLSVDGLKDNYEKYRKNGKWDILIENLEKISKCDFSVKCYINFVATEFNYRDIEPLIELSKKYNLNNIRINIAQDWNEDKVYTFKYPKEMVSYLKKYKKYIIGKSIWDYNNCFWPNTGTYINVFGDVKTCCLTTDGISFGNIFKDTIKDIQSTSKFINLKKSLNDNIPPKQCVNCSYKSLTKVLQHVKG